MPPGQLGFPGWEMLAARVRLRCQPDKQPWGLFIKSIPLTWQLLPL